MGSVPISITSDLARLDGHTYLDVIQSDIIFRTKGTTINFMTELNIFIKLSYLKSTC